MQREEACIGRIHDKEVRLRVERFLDLLTVIGARSHELAPNWIFSVQEIEDRLFASFLYSGLTQDSASAKRLFYDDFDGKWRAFVEMASTRKDTILQRIFQGIYPKGHINPRLKPFIYGKNGFSKSIPYSYFQLTSAYRVSQQSFLKRPFPNVFGDLQKINGIGRTLAFDVASTAFVVAPKELSELEPDRIYLKGSSGPIKGFSLMLGGKRETRWNQVRATVAAILRVDLADAEKAIAEFERCLVNTAYDYLRKVKPSVERYDALLELENLICNYQKPVNGDWEIPNKFLRGEVDGEEFAKIVTERHYKGRSSLSVKDIEPRPSPV